MGCVLSVTAAPVTIIARRRVNMARRSDPRVWLVQGNDMMTQLRYVGPTSQPADLGWFLLVHRLTHDEDEPGMALEIDRMQEEG
jgi:hypothetical protein